MWNVQSSAPGKVSCYYRGGVDSQFDTFVANLTYVRSHCAVRITVGRNCIIKDQIFCALVVVFDGTGQSVVEESEVNTDVEHACTLPFQVWISIFGSGQCTVAGGWSCDGIHVSEPTRCTVSLLCGIGVKSQWVTAYTIAYAEFQVIKHFLILHEILFCNAPCQWYGRECTPAVVLAESGRTIASYGSLEQVLAVKTVVYAAIEWNHAQGWKFVVAINAVNIHIVGQSHIVIFQVIVVKVVYS